MKSLNFTQIVDSSILIMITLVVTVWNDFVSINELVAAISYILVGSKIGYSKYQDDEAKKLKAEMKMLQEKVRNL